MNDGNFMFSDIVSFIEHETTAANDPIFSEDALYNLQQTLHKTHQRCTNSQWNNSENDKQLVCSVCDENHDMDICPRFVEMTMEEKKSFIMNKHLCFGCYGPGHVSKDCMKKRRCDKCKKRHPTALHIESFNRNG